MKLIILTLVALAVLAAIFTPLPAVEVSQAQTVVAAQQQAPAADPNARYFPETAKWITNYLPDGTLTGFYDFWKSEGLARLGYPITGAYIEGGKPVQYTERARLELHPGGVIRLGLLGAEGLTGVRAITNTVEVVREVQVTDPVLLKEVADTRAEITAVKAVNSELLNKSLALTAIAQAAQQPDFVAALQSVVTGGVWAKLTDDEKLAFLRQTIAYSRAGDANASFLDFPDVQK